MRRKHTATTALDTDGNVVARKKQLNQLALTSFGVCTVCLTDSSQAKLQLRLASNAMSTVASHVDGLILFQNFEIAQDIRILGWLNDTLN